MHGNDKLRDSALSLSYLRRHPYVLLPLLKIKITIIIIIIIIILIIIMNKLYHRVAYYFHISQEICIYHFCQVFLVARRY